MFFYQEPLLVSLSATIKEAAKTRRERNREAASRCRERKKQRTDALLQVSAETMQWTIPLKEAASLLQNFLP